MIEGLYSRGVYCCWISQESKVRSKCCWFVISLTLESESPLHIFIRKVDRHPVLFDVNPVIVSIHNLLSFNNMPEIVLCVVF